MRIRIIHRGDADGAPYLSRMVKRFGELEHIVQASPTLPGIADPQADIDDHYDLVLFLITDALLRDPTWPTAKAAIEHLGKRGRPIVWRQTIGEEGRKISERLGSFHADRPELLLGQLEKELIRVAGRLPRLVSEPYEQFSRSVQTDMRYRHREEVKAFIEKVVDGTVTKLLDRGRRLYRARIGRFEKEVDLHAPPPHKAKVNRANPDGIPMLYAATDTETAVAEVRPWIGADVSVATLEIVEDIDVANCVHWDQGLKDEARALQQAVDNAFAQPVQRDESAMGYVPTQILAEAFKEKKNIKGLRYRSAVGPGLNVALFDRSLARFVSSEILRVTYIGVEVQRPSGIGSAPGGA